MDQFIANQPVRVLSGKWAGAVGTVEEVTDQRVRVHIAGIFNGEPVDVRTWLARKALEVFRGA